MNYDKYDLKAKQQTKISDKYAIRYHQTSKGWQWQYWNTKSYSWCSFYNNKASNEAAKITAAMQIYQCKSSEVKIIKRKLNNP